MLLGQYMLHGFKMPKLWYLRLQAIPKLSYLRVDIWEDKGASPLTRQVVPLRVTKGRRHESGTKRADTCEIRNKSFHAPTSRCILMGEANANCKIHLFQRRDARIFPNMNLELFNNTEVFLARLAVPFRFPEGLVQQTALRVVFKLFSSSCIRCVKYSWSVYLYFSIYASFSTSQSLSYCSLLLI